MKAYVLHIVIIIHGICLYNPLYGQIKTDVSVNNPYREKAERVKKDYQRLKKQYKDSIQDIKQDYQGIKDAYDSLRKSVKHLDKIDREEVIDSLVQLESISQKQRQALEWLKKGKPTKKEFIDLVQQRAQRIEEIKHLQQEWKEATALIDSLKNFELDKDSVLLHYQQHLETRLKDALTEEGFTDAFGEGELTLKELQSLPQEYQARFNNQLSSLEQQTQTIKEAKLPRVPRQLNINHFADKAPQLQKGLDKLKTLKAKYSKVLNSQDMSTAIKKNSLKESSTKERLVIGGSLQLEAGNPTLIDFNPILGYRLNKRWTAAIGGTYRAKFGSRSGEEPNVMGYRTFLQYEVIQSFVAHAEYESLHQSILQDSIATTENNSPQWTHSAFVGLGKTFKITKTLKSQVLFLYNLNHRDDGPHRRPWVIRFAIFK